MAIYVTVKDTSGLFIEDFVLGKSNERESSAKDKPAMRRVMSAMVDRHYDPEGITFGKLDFDEDLEVRHALMVVYADAKKNPALAGLLTEPNE